MKNNTPLHYLSRQHLEAQLWKEEIAFTKVELPLLRKMLEMVDAHALSGADGNKLQAFNQQMGHFSRLVPHLEQEVIGYDREVADCWQGQQDVSADLRKAHQYIRQEMDDFHYNYILFKRGLRLFVAQHDAVVA